jgi:hypothetical protein
MGEVVKVVAKKPEAKKENRASQRTELFHSISPLAEQILFLQRTIGNQAVQRLIKSGALQAKLNIGRPGDIYEQEADRVAEQVMRIVDSDQKRAGSAIAELPNPLGDVGHIVQRQSRPTSPLLPEIWDRLAPWLKQGTSGQPSALSQNPALWDVLLVLYARIGPSLWSHIRQITWVGERGEMEFIPEDERRLIVALFAEGYTTSYFAGLGNRWGLREPNVDVAGLHWRGMPGGNIVNVHIDLHPPSWTGLWHKIQDDWRRSTTHTPESLRAGVERLGTYIPVLYEQRLHGELTVRFNDLHGKARGMNDVQAAITRGRQYLQAASRIIWTRSLISQAELSQAFYYIYQAGLEAERAENLLKGVK